MIIHLISKYSTLCYHGNNLLFQLQSTDTAKSQKYLSNFKRSFCNFIQRSIPKQGLQKYRYLEGRTNNLRPCKKTRKMTPYCAEAVAWPLGQTEIYVGERCLSIPEDSRRSFFKRRNSCGHESMVTTPTGPGYSLAKM